MWDSVDTTDAFRYHWKVWRFCGFKFPPRGSCWRILSIVFALLFVLMPTVLTPASFIINFFLSRSIRDCLENLYLTTTMVNSSLKFINLFIIRNELEKVDNILAALDSRAVRSKERKVLRSGIKCAQRCFLTFLTLYLVTNVCNMLTTVFSQERTIPYPAWFPWDWQRSLGMYLLTICSLTIFVSMQALLGVCSDTYASAYLGILAAQIKVLAMRVEALGEKAQECGSSCPEEQKREYMALVECIKDHETIQSLFSTIQKPIARTGLIQFACSGLAQCTIGVYVLYVDLELTRLAGIVSLLGAVTLQTFVLCYSGEIICQEYINLEKAIYACNWEDQNQPFGKAILLFLQRVQKTNCILAGNLVPVRLPTFVQNVQMAYSAFAVLNELKSRVVN